MAKLNVTKDDKMRAEIADAFSKGLTPLPLPDPINPAHYRSNPSGVECIEIIENMTLCRGTAIKYLWRAGEKDPTKEIEDLKKARWFVDREISRLEKTST